MLKVIKSNGIKNPVILMGSRSLLLVPVTSDCLWNTEMLVPFTESSSSQFQQQARLPQSQPIRLGHVLLLLKSLEIKS